MYLDAAKTRFTELNLAASDEITPCTEAEVKALELQLGCALPQAYREFLLWMGHGAGSFLRGSSCFYHHLPRLRASAIELLKENHFSQPLPIDAFVFFMHQGYQFNFLRSGVGDNPQVYFYGEWTDQSDFLVIYSSFAEFLMQEIEDHAKLTAT